MGIGKTLGISIVFYLVLNAVFLILYVALGGFIVGGNPVGLGPFFSDYVGNDYMGFLSAIMVPGGGNLILFNSTVDKSLYFLGQLFADTPAVETAPAIIGLLWVILPGLLTGIITGLKFADESSKTAFFGIMLGIIIVAIIPMVLSIVGQVSPLLPNHDLTQVLVPAYYYPLNDAGTEILWSTGAYFVPIMYGLFDGFLWGGFGAAMASNL